MNYNKKERRKQNEEKCFVDSIETVDGFYSVYYVTKYRIFFGKRRNQFFFFPNFIFIIQNLN